MNVIGQFYDQFGDHGYKFIGGDPDTVVKRPKKQLPKRVASLLQGGPRNWQVYYLRYGYTNVIGVLKNLKDEERTSQRDTDAEVSIEDLIDYPQYIYYVRTEQVYNGMPIFAFGETPKSDDPSPNGPLQSGPA
jgi:hypothetical protein